MNFSDDIINKVWEKGIVVDGYNPDLYRKDFCGAWMMRSEYGNTENILGWEIDHVYPVGKGGTDVLINLRPMQHQNNLSKSDDYPSYTGVIVAKDSKNVEVTSTFTIHEDLQKKLSEIYKK